MTEFSPWSLAGVRVVFCQECRADWSKGRGDRCANIGQQSGAVESVDTATPEVLWCLYLAPPLLNICVCTHISHLLCVCVCVHRLSVLQGQVVLAVRQQYIAIDNQLVTLGDGDEVAVVPPLSGG